jgi:GT2 family glycosyltransferase
MTEEAPRTPEAYGYLQRILSERLNTVPLQKAQSGLTAQFELVRYELAQAHSERAQAQADMQATRERLAEAQDARQQTLQVLDAAQGRVAFLEETLTQALRRPLKPLRQAVQRRFAYIAAWIVRPFSKRREAKFRASAAKRNPRRYLGGGGGTARPVASSSEPWRSDDVLYARQTREISKRFLSSREDMRPAHLDIGSAEFVRALLKAAPVGSSTLPDSEIGFSILTPYFAHEAFFVDCAKSVAAAAIRVNRPVEWVVFNDDPAMPDDRLKSLIPETLQGKVQIVSDGQNHGIALGQNRAASASRYAWLVLLDCDDMLEPQALEVLEAAIAEEPCTRYFSSLIIDIDERGAELRRRRREHVAADLFDAGMVVGHMVAVRKDLFETLGGFDPRFTGVQDYDFALRVARREQIGCLPAHLYRYRWHDRTQSVSGASRQASLSNAVRSAFLIESLALPRPGPVSSSALPKTPRALCVVRTQGGRMELLEETLASIREQSLPVTPCIVVHGDDALHDFVQRQLALEFASHQDNPAVLLKAPDTGRRRGYPCNVALDYLAEHRDRFDLLCFLDDDDHYLPGFADRLVQLMRATGADLAYGATNALPKAGEPVAQHKLLPFTALLGGNFIPFNSFVVRSEAVLAAQARFDERMHYLEDYDFLVQLLLAGVRAEPLYETVSEYRILGDGNAAIKQDIAHFEDCQAQVRRRIVGASIFGSSSATVKSAALTEAAFLADVLAFPLKSGPGLWGDQELAHLKFAHDVLKQVQRLK